MDRLGTIQVFAQVVESGSFAKAAAKLGLSTSAASRHVAELEAHLQTRLLNRTTRRVSLTESGQAFYERAVQLLADLEEAEQEAGRAAIVPRGTIRLTTSVNFGVRHLAPAIAEFLAQHQEVRFDVQLADRVVDLVEEGFDLAVRIGTAGPGNLVARKLGETRLVPCASPLYLSAHPAPNTPEDLAAHNCFTYEYVTPRNVWRFQDAGGRERAVRVAGTLHSNNATSSRRPQCAAPASSSSRLSLSGPMCGQGAWSPCCRNTRRRRCRSTPSIRAASTFPLRCGASSSS
jgi:DNA-binding transcriptional LysR family regulator